MSPQAIARTPWPAGIIWSRPFWIFFKLFKFDRPIIFFRVVFAMQSEKPVPGKADVILKHNQMFIAPVYSAIIFIWFIQICIWLIQLTPNSWHLLQTHCKSNLMRKYNQRPIPKNQPMWANPNSEFDCFLFHHDCVLSFVLVSWWQVVAGEAAIGGVVGLLVGGPIIGMMDIFCAAHLAWISCFRWLRIAWSWSSRVRNHPRKRGEIFIVLF